MGRTLQGLIAGVALALCSSLHAAPTHCLPPPHPADLGVTDVMLGTVAASDCYGIVQASSNTAATIGFDNFTPLLVDAAPNGAAVTNTLDGSGVTFTLDVSYAGSDQTSGAWSLDWSGGTAPLTLDLVAVLQSPNSFASYFFNDVVLGTTPGSSTGSWFINYVLGTEGMPTLSSFSIYAGDLQGATPPPTAVDEPASAALLAVAVLALGFVRRRFPRT